MSVLRKIQKRKEARKKRSRHKILRGERPRVAVFRSLNNIYAQLIDDNEQITIASFSSKQLEKAAGDKKSIARQVGKELAKLAQDKGIKEAIFDRSGYLYHGRVKELAEGLREGGLNL